jgi:hypothetical protein
LKSKSQIALLKLFKSKTQPVDSVGKVGYFTNRNIGKNIKSSSVDWLCNILGDQKIHHYDRNKTAD